MRHRGTHETEEQHAHNKPYARSSFYMKRFKVRALLPPQEVKMESESVANIFEDAKAFMEKSFGCSLCGEMFESEKEFVEHCSNHKSSPTDDLFIDLWCNSQHF